MCPQIPRLFPEYSHKAELQTVITGMPLQIRSVTRSGHAGPVTMGRITRGPLSWTRPHGGVTTSQAFVWRRIKRRVFLPVLSPSDQRLQRRPRAKGDVFAFAQQSVTRMPARSAECRRQATDHGRCGAAAPAQGPGSASVFRPHTPAGAVQCSRAAQAAILLPVACLVSKANCQPPTHSAGSRTYTLAAAAASSVPRRRAHRRRCSQRYSFTSL
jgi:hypothetical protein